MDLTNNPTFGCFVIAGHVKFDSKFSNILDFIRNFSMPINFVFHLELTINFDNLHHPAQSIMPVIFILFVVLLPVLFTVIVRNRPFTQELDKILDRLFVELRFSKIMKPDILDHWVMIRDFDANWIAWKKVGQIRLP